MRPAREDFPCDGDLEVPPPLGEGRGENASSLLREGEMAPVGDGNTDPLGDGSTVPLHSSVERRRCEELCDEA